MANSGCWLKNIGQSLLHISLFVLCFSRADGNHKIPPSLVHSWADKIGNELYSLTKEITAYDKVYQAYNDGNFTVKNLNQSVGEAFAKSLEELLEPKVDALTKLKDKARTAEDEHQYDKSKQNYRKIKEIKTDNSTLNIVPTFSTTVKINTTYSWVQVPTNIYDQDPSVVSIAQWTKKLDEVYTENYKRDKQFPYKRDKQLLWQYFGSAEGVFRTYPGHKWPLTTTSNDKKADMYDARRRLWFIQASASAKDMIIVIDRSGTMIGNNIGIAKTAAMSIIDTLQENDFFNVLYFNDQVNYVMKDCDKKLIQATKENKEIMQKAIQGIPKPTKTGDVGKAIEEAFELFIRSKDSNQTSAKCNKVIVFFSDGVEGDYAAEKEFNKYNKDSNVGARVFSFLVGRKKDPPVAAMQKMSCANRGYFYRIETVGNVWDTVLEYTKVLSRPLALADPTNKNDPPVIYTPLYLDASGLGMMMTAALPVFSKKNPRLLGVVGTDIVVGTLKDLVPHQKVGVHGYGFAINNNGFLLFHPKLRDQTGYLPAPPNVYLEDVEHSVSNESIYLKINMINRQTSNMNFPAYVTSRNGKRYIETEMHYYYAPVPGTPFSACIVVTGYGLQYLTLKQALTDPERNSGLDALKPSDLNTTAMVAPWPYCEIVAAAQQDQELSKKAYPTAAEIYKHLKNVTDFSKCFSALLPILWGYAGKKTLTSDLLLSAAKILQSTNSKWNITKMLEKKITSIFAGTSSGYSRAVYEGDSPPIKRDVIKEEFYEHATDFARMKEQTVVFSIPVRPNSPSKRVNLSSLAVTISTPVTVGDEKTVGAVLGMRMKSDTLNELLLNMTRVSNCTTENCKQLDCNNTKKYGCYLVDESGYVVASNGGNNEVGIFFGMLQGQLMRNIISNTTVNITDNIVYISKRFLDTQAECPAPSSQGSSASRLLSPFFTVAGYVKWWSHTLAMLLAQYTLFSSWSSSNQVLASSSTKNESCTKFLDIYKLRENLKVNVSGKVDCTTPTSSPRCLQNYTITNVKHTNLILIVLDKCDNKCNLRPLKHTPMKVEPKTGGCGAQPARYRRLVSDYCYKEHENERGPCGSAGNIRPTLYILAAAIFTIFILLK